MVAGGSNPQRTRARNGKGKVIYGSPLVDVAATEELALETVEMCDMILRLTDLDIRLLSKSPRLATVVAQELAKRFPDTKNGAKNQVWFLGSPPAHWTTALLRRSRGLFRYLPHV